MPFGKKADSSVRAYLFGLRDPLVPEQFKAAQASMEKRVQLWNLLVETEIERRRKVEETLRPHLPVLPPELQAKVDAKERFKPTAEEKPLLKAYREARQAAFKLEENQAFMQKIDKEAYEAQKVCCRAVKCFTWQEDDVLTSFRAAAKKPHPPKFQRYRYYEGICALRWQTGLRVSEALCAEPHDTRMRLDPRPVDPHDNRPILPDPNSNRSKRRDWRLLKFRVGSDEKRKPIWFEAHVCVHRPLPPDGLIRKAYLRWWRVGTHLRFSLALVVATPGLEASIQSLGLEVDPRQRAALDLGWRQLPAVHPEAPGVRVGYLLDENGHAQEFILPGGWVGEANRVERIRSHRDLNFNEARTQLAQFREKILTENPDGGLEPATFDDKESPSDGLVIGGGSGLGSLENSDGNLETVTLTSRDSFLEETKTLMQWRSPGRLASLVLRWRNRRFEGDEEAFTLLETWRKRDKHLLCFEANLRDQLLARRKDLYRKWACELTRHYRLLAIEEFDLSEIARKEKAQEIPPEARHVRFLAAPSTFRLALQNACRREAVQVLKLPSQNTTRMCSICGHIATPEEFDAAVELSHRCGICGTIRDQDHNAAENLLQEAYVREPQTLMGVDYAQKREFKRIDNVPLL